MAGTHRRDPVAHPILSGTEPAHGLAELAELRAQVVLAVPVAERRVTAVDESLYSAPMGLPVTPKIDPCTNCG
jgi:hypothetical protein